MEFRLFRVEVYFMCLLLFQEESISSVLSVKHFWGHVCIYIHIYTHVHLMWNLCIWVHPLQHLHICNTTAYIYFPVISSAYLCLPVMPCAFLHCQIPVRKLKKLLILTTPLNGPLKVSPMGGRFREVLLYEYICTYIYLYAHI